MRHRRNLDGQLFAGFFDQGDSKLSTAPALAGVVERSYLMSQTMKACGDVWTSSRAHPH